MRSQLSDENRNEFDDDADRLVAPVKKTHISLAELRVIRSYTINFNPAVEHQLRLEWAARRVTAQPKGNGEPSELLSAAAKD